MEQMQPTETQIAQPPIAPSHSCTCSHLLAPFKNGYLSGESPWNTPSPDTSPPIHFAGLPPTSYLYVVYPPTFDDPKCPPKYRRGDTVWVQLRSDKETGHAVALEDEAPDGRVLVRFRCCGVSHRVRRDRLTYVMTNVPRDDFIPGLKARAKRELEEPPEANQEVHVERPAGDGTGTGAAVGELGELLDDTTTVHPYGIPNPRPPTVLITASTTHYRHLARSHTHPYSLTLEIGASYGLCTDVLVQHSYYDASRVLGVDTSVELVDEARRRYPGARFERVDVLSEKGWARVVRLVEELAAKGAGAEGKPPPPLTVFVDVGGSRPMLDVAPLVARVQRNLGPALVVVKCEELAAEAEKRVDLGARSWAEGEYAKRAWWKEGWVVGGGEWFERLSVGDLGQLK
ncbi:hypothetical protein M427DRAFT_246682 [Gonapodya prolifera JEL478]|uniref:Methyltransferase domain-containing protein n=1 Tax=Gonapodya prolifera (strain JEL478) TaxID=1344416 RepID=A0A139AM25_GONPJ|nr:hypothetical protein M427DRAFT_246682 [Gonapodya prolifera JEL478]|eukprot:KXS17809.1 hypothetical protein M427DRAFT_246682 [Gonapodya prolifera JEL478]